VREILERRGIAFRLASGVEAVEAGPGGAARVVVKGGEALEADLVPVSAGVRPDVALAREAGLAVGKGITVDDRLATSAPGIWAAGDCAEHRTGLYGFWSASGDQGKMAGSILAGLDVSYLGSVRQTTLKVADVGVFCIGDLAAPADREEAVREGDSCRCIRMDAQGRVTGAVLVGALDLRKALTVAALTGRPFRPAQG
jgi:nitrite reductase (NADH) large subunit